MYHYLRTWLLSLEHFGSGFLTLEGFRTLGCRVRRSMAVPGGDTREKEKGGGFHEAVHGARGVDDREFLGH